MKNILKVFVLMCCIVCIQCNEKDNTFLITENSVGALLNTTPLNDLDNVFAADSIVRDTTIVKLGAANKKIEVFEKGGKHLLTLTPNQDSTATIENIRIFDARYQTANGIGLNSTFKEIQKNYTIKKIVSTLNSIVVFPKGSNLYFTIDRKELPSNLQYTNKSIEAVQIPDDAKIKYLMLGWE